MIDSMNKYSKIIAHDEKIPKYLEELMEGWYCLVEAEKLNIRNDPSGINHDDLCVDATNHFVNADEEIQRMNNKKEFPTMDLEYPRWGLAMAYLMLDKLDLASNEIDTAISQIQSRFSDKSIEYQLETIFWFSLEGGAFFGSEDVRAQFREGTIDNFFESVIKLCDEKFSKFVVTEFFNNSGYLEYEKKKS